MRISSRDVTSHFNDDLWKGGCFEDSKRVRVGKVTVACAGPEKPTVEWRRWPRSPCLFYDRLSGLIQRSDGAHRHLDNTTAMYVDIARDERVQSPNTKTAPRLSPEYKSPLFYHLHVSKRLRRNSCCNVSSHAWVGASFFLKASSRAPLNLAQMTTSHVLESTVCTTHWNRHRRLSRRIRQAGQVCEMSDCVLGSLGHKAKPWPVESFCVVRLVPLFSRLLSVNEVVRIEWRRVLGIRHSAAAGIDCDSVLSARVPKICKIHGSTYQWLRGSRVHQAALNSAEDLEGDIVKACQHCQLRE